MLYQTGRVIGCVLMIFTAVGFASSQANPEKTATATISGKVTVKNKGVAGIVVFAHPQNVTGRESYRGTTDQNGSYRISNLRAGTYVVTPVAPSMAFQDEQQNNALVVDEGESVDDINFSMIQGGVITGKITDADGRPVIEANVAVLPTGAQFFDRQLTGIVGTDDRGIYRAYGLRPGKYKVSVGQESYLSSTRLSYRKTFYPSVTEYEKAKVIEVTEGSETKDVDIMVGRPLPGFRISGRIVDVETAKPLPNIKYGLNQSLGGGSSTSVVGRNFTNSNGEFSLDNVLPGTYTLFIVPEESGVRGDSVSFEIVDRDVSDLEITAGRAASLSGMVVVEAEESATAIKPTDLLIDAWVENKDQYFGSHGYPVSPDGSFKIGGLQKGRIHFRLSSHARNDLKPIDIVRVERAGVAQTTGLILKDGEQVTGLRLFVKYLTGAIHGEVKIEGDELRPDAQLSLWLVPLDTSSNWYQSNGGNSPRLDARKRFAAEGLAAGIYEVNIAVYEPGRPDTDRVYKQQVTVTDNVVSEVTITIKTKP